MNIQRTTEEIVRAIQSGDIAICSDLTRKLAKKVDDEKQKLLTFVRALELSDKWKDAYDGTFEEFLEKHDICCPKDYRQCFPSERPSVPQERHSRGVDSEQSQSS